MASYSHVSKSVNITKSYLQKRKAGLLQSAKTCSKALDDVLLNGIPYYTIVTIAGSSGSGKSTFVESIKYSILDEDPTVVTLDIQLDMDLKSNILRRISKKTGIPYTKLILKDDIPLPEEETKLVEEELTKLSKYPIYTAEGAITVDDISDMIDDIIVSNDFKDPITGEVKKKLVVQIDYLGLVRAKRGDDRKMVLDSLYAMMIQKKKMLAEEEIPVIFMCISQLNRGVFDALRVSNKAHHYPSPSDVMGSSEIFNGSDIVVMNVVPSKIKGIGDSYGVYNKPLKSLMGNPIMYSHVMKNRFGPDDNVLALETIFKTSTIRDYNYA
jgi:replicative DNA helicase